MKVTTTQLSHAPGSNVEVVATLTESGIPLEGRASVNMDVTAPDGTAQTVALREEEPGVHRAILPLPQAGHYPLLVKAAGQAFSGKPFTREELRSAATWVDPTGPGAVGGDGGKVIEAIQKCCRNSTRLMTAIAILLLLFLILLLLLGR